MSRRPVKARSDPEERELLLGMYYLTEATVTDVARSFKISQAAAHNIIKDFGPEFFQRWKEDIESLQQERQT